MLSSTDLTRFLSHDQLLVRDHALHSLAVASARCGVKADAALAVLDQMGSQAFSHPSQIGNLPHTDQSVQWILTALTSSKAYFDNGPASWAVEMEQTILMRHRDRIAAIVDNRTRDRLNRRILLGEQSPQDLWRRLEQAHNDRPLTEDLVQALVCHDEFVSPLISDVLSAAAGHPLELSAIELAGHIRLGSAVVPLIDRLGSANANVADYAAVALGWIGTLGAVNTIELRFGSGTPDFRQQAAECLGYFRIPSVEAALERMAAEEDDQEVLTTLCYALMDICTTGGFDELLEIIRHQRCGKPTPKMLKSTAALATMLKRELPESNQWQTQIQQDEKTNGQQRQSWANLFQSKSATQPATDTDAASPPPTPPKPIRNTEPKVGRNDPCPCGSGKKYKKCCG